MVKMKINLQSIILHPLPNYHITWHNKMVCQAYYSGLYIQGHRPRSNVKSDSGASHTYPSLDFHITWHKCPT